MLNALDGCDIPCRGDIDNGLKSSFSTGDITMNPFDNKQVFTNLAAEFPALVEQCVQSFSRTPERDLHILRRRYGLDGGPVNTLDELGACHDVSRQRVNQVQVRCVKRIRQILQGGVRNHRLHASSHHRRQLVTLIEELREVGPCLSRTRFQAVVRSRFGRGVPGHWFGLFAEVLGYHLLQPTSGVVAQGLKERWIESDSLSQKTVNQVFESLKELQKCPEGVPLATLLDRLNTEGHASLSEAWLKGIIAACSRLQITRGEIVRIRTEWLSSAADQAWRVLVASRKPLSRDEITRRVNRVRVGKRDLAPMSVESVASQMSGDQRFACAGKSGLWGLLEWGTVRDITIVEAMEKVLHAAGKPLSIKALIRNTLKLRPDAAQKSVRSYVQQRPDLFAPANRGRIALVSWGLKIASQETKPRLRCSNSDFIAAVELTSESRESMPLMDLIEGIVDLTGACAPTVRQRLKQLDGIRMEVRTGRKGKIVHFADQISLKPNVRSKTNREQIKKTIRTMIEEEGIVFERKKDLYERVNRQLPCERSTFYRYLREMNSTPSGAGRTSTVPLNWN
jgi:hypothetical protein